jgi:caffeoyl-CoA O-methyltransferase
VSSAFDAFDEVEGEFDIVYCDIDKDGYPEAWRRAHRRVRVGGLFICDNVLWSGRVAAENDETDPTTEAIKELNRMVAGDRAFRDTIVPTRDGVLVALRIE